MTDTTRDAFEAWWTASCQMQCDDRFGAVRDGWEIWQAATLAERERCALVCDKVDSEQMAKVKQTGQNHYEDYAIGAELCTTAIRCVK